MAGAAPKAKKGDKDAGPAVLKLPAVNVEQRKKIDLRAGDTVKVSQKILEGGKIRSQAFEGLVLARKHGTEAGATFTVRKVTSGIGVEKIFPLYSPSIEKIEIIRRAKVRQAKLYHIRKKAAKEISREMRRVQQIRTPEVVAEPAAPAEASAPQASAPEAQAVAAS